MSRLVARLAVVALVVTVLTGCGGSSSKTASAGTSPSGDASTRASEPATTPLGPRTTTSGDQNGTPQSATSTAGASDVRLPAMFTIRSGGTLAPASITAPAGIPIELTIVSGDGKAHQVILRSSTRHSLSVAAGGRASLLIAGLRAGRYALVVDGPPRGALVVGGSPGP